MTGREGAAGRRICPAVSYREPVYKAYTTGGAARLLPAAVARRWSDVPLPKDLVEGCGLASNAVLSDLAAPVTPRDHAAFLAVRLFAQEIFKARSAEIAPMRLAPAGSDLPRLLRERPWSTRLRSLLVRVGKVLDPERVATLTYGELLRTPGVRVTSVIELGIELESFATQPPPEPRRKAPPAAIHRVRTPKAFTEAPPGLPGEPAADAEPTRRTAIELVGPVKGATLKALKRIAASEASRLLSGADRRFTDLIPDNGESLATIAARLIAGAARPPQSTLIAVYGSTAPPEPVSLAAWTARLESRLARLELLTLEESLAELLAACTGHEGRVLTALLATLGWSGQPQPLKAVARELSIARERMRRFETHARKRLPVTPTYVPALERALELLAQAAPITPARASELLMERGITRIPFSPDSVFAAAVDLHLALPIKITVGGGIRLVVRASAAVPVAQILKTLREKVARSSVVSIKETAAELSLRFQGPCTEEEVRRVLAASPQFRLLGRSWLWATGVQEYSKSVASLCRLMLCVTPALTLPRLMDGLDREYRLRSIATHGRLPNAPPPIDVLRAFLKDHPDFRVDGDDRVSAAQPLNAAQHLPPIDRTIVDILRGAPHGVLRRDLLIQECLERGFGEDTVCLRLSYGCLLERVGPSLWAVRGTVDAAALSARRD